MDRSLCVLIDYWGLRADRTRHGSNIGKVKLTVRCDPDTKELILYLPTLTASKGRDDLLDPIMMYSIVASLLLLTGHASDKISLYMIYGVHFFVTQVRDGRTYEPLPGIMIRDIVSKYGYNTMDNASMLLNIFGKHPTLTIQCQDCEPLPISKELVSGPLQAEVLTGEELVEDSIVPFVAWVKHACNGCFEPERHCRVPSSESPPTYATADNGPFTSTIENYSILLATCGPAIPTLCARHA